MQPYPLVEGFKREGKQLGTNQVIRFVKARRKTSARQVDDHERKNEEVRQLEIRFGVIMALSCFEPSNLLKLPKTSGFQDRRITIILFLRI
jgi:hypothetical protein